MTDLKTVLDPGNVFPSHSFLGKEQNLHSKSQDQKRKIQKDLQKRHIFVDQINIISGRIPGLEMIVSGAACYTIAFGAYQFS